MELQCSRARSAIEASAAAATTAFNFVLQRQRAAALQVIDSYHDSQVGTIAELHVALQEHSSSIGALVAEASSAMQADPETVMMSALFIPALTSASFEGQACAKAAFSVHKAQNETNVVFVPRAVQVVDEALMLGEIVISGQHESIEAADAPANMRSRALPGGSTDVEQSPADVAGEDIAISTQDDVDMKSWSAMSSQKRSKAIETLLRRQLGDWKPPPLVKKVGNGHSSSPKMRPTTLEAPPSIGSSTKKPAPPARSNGRGGGSA